MRNWWENLNLRERYIILLAAIIGLFIGIDTLVLTPFKTNVNLLDEQVDQAREDLIWMKEAVFRLPDPRLKKQAIDPGRVVTFVDGHITRLGLKKHMQQMTPIENHGARIRLSDIEFSRLLTFLNAMDGALKVDEVRLTPTEILGFVNATLVVSNGKHPS